jgi:uncharacterized protein YecE (DUF72 family)
MIKIGTSGFSYPDWIGTVYPEGLPEREHLSFYAAEFSTVEINMTYYRVPDPRTAQGWARKTPEGFLFSVKAFQGLTHEREQPDFAGFATAVQPLVQAGKLACILAQFPYSFHPTPANRDYLKQLRDGLGDLPTVVEFREAGWLNQETFDLLRLLRLGFCSVDEPRLKGLMPPMAIATGPISGGAFASGGLVAGPVGRAPRFGALPSSAASTPVGGASRLPALSVARARNW